MTISQIHHFRFAPSAVGLASVAATARNDSNISIPIRTSVNEATKRLVQATIEQYAGNKPQAARMLDIPTRTMTGIFQTPASDVARTE